MPGGRCYRNCVAWVCWGFALAAVLAGCSPQAELAYTPREDLRDLPPKQQEQIAAALARYFGTPRFPRFMEVAPPEQQPAEASEPVLIEKYDRALLVHGREVYQRQCAGCHGTTGDGKGPAAAYLNPPPRDYRLGRFKFTSTPRGAKPRRADLVRIIRYGAKGTSMPSFRFMPDDELEAVITYVILLSSRGELEYRLKAFAEQNLGETDDLTPADVAEQAQVVAASWAQAESQVVRPLTPQPPYDESSIDAGARAFVRLNCYKCHGRDGRGNKTLDVGKDDWGRVAYAADLTTGMLHGGRRPIDIYRRIYSGINGTPMPAFAQPDAAQGETETQRSETIWHLVHFVTSIVEGRPLPLAVLDEEIERQRQQQPAATAPAAGGG
jgi:mono/diheme cytochrome c family protein